MKTLKDLINTELTVLGENIGTISFDIKVSSRKYSVSEITATYNLLVQTWKWGARYGITDTSIKMDSKEIYIPIKEYNRVANKIVVGNDIDIVFDNKDNNLRGTILFKDQEGTIIDSLENITSDGYGDEGFIGDKFHMLRYGIFNDQFSSLVKI